MGVPHAKMKKLDEDARVPGLQLVSGRGATCNAAGLMAIGLVGGGRLHVGGWPDTHSDVCDGVG